MPDSFEGFSPKVLTFFRQLEKNNDRAWFAARKEFFDEEVKLPMELLVAAVGRQLKRRAPEYVPPDARKAMYRIYRDTRFSRDKTPYKTHVAAHFPSVGFNKDTGAGFYFQVSHQYVGVAGGIYRPPPEGLKVLREAIARDTRAFAKLATSPKLTKRMGELYGEAKKRTPKGFEPGSPADAYLRMTQYFFWKELDAKAALSPTLPEVIADHMLATLDFCGWVNSTLMAARGTDEENKPVRPAPMF